MSVVEESRSLVWTWHHTMALQWAQRREVRAEVGVVIGSCESLWKLGAIECKMVKIFQEWNLYVEPWGTWTFMWNGGEPELFRVEPLCGTLWTWTFKMWNLGEPGGRFRVSTEHPQPNRSFIGRTPSFSSCWGKKLSAFCILIVCVWVHLCRRASLLGVCWSCLVRSVCVAKNIDGWALTQLPIPSYPWTKNVRICKTGSGQAKLLVAIKHSKLLWIDPWCKSL